MSNPLELLWKPNDALIENSNLKAFECWLKSEKGLSFTNYDELWKWSVSELEEFWVFLAEYFNVRFHSNYTKVVSDDVMPGVKWFEGASLNYAEHIFRHADAENPAIIFQNEKERVYISWEELTQKVSAVREFLIANDIKAGDCVAAFLPNVPETIISFLAVNSIGAVWSCCSPDFGVDTVIERFMQIKPKLLIAVDGYQYNGKPYLKIPQVTEIREGIESIGQTIFLPYLDSDSRLPDSVLWQDVITSSPSQTLEFEAVPFDHPIWVLYSSGTTGRPKAITHSHGGVLLEHLKYMSLHNDVKAGENFFWFTTTGWMMWNFLQASMLVGATPVLYDGSPGFGSLETLWKLTEELPIHHFGTSAPYLTACMKQELNLNEKFDFKNLRSIGSTGAPLQPEVFDWIYKHISKQVWLCSMSGGTDVCTAFVGGNPYLPVYKGAIQCRALGCAMYAYDEQGERVENALGEMVVEKPMPSMPIYFWNDTDNARYQESYFEEYPGKWRHGDWIKIFDDGSLIIQGRSDATLNRKGIRIGTAEIYNVLDAIHEIKDSLILNLEQNDGEDIMPLFVVTQGEQPLGKDLIDRINLDLRKKCSPRHVPDLILKVPDIPYTLSGKKMEVPIKKIFMKMDVSKSVNRDAIRNPEALDYFIELSNTHPFTQEK
jgi:acetoacetyl-CoA synthetase